MLVPECLKKEDSRCREARISKSKKSTSSQAVVGTLSTPSRGSRTRGGARRLRGHQGFGVPQPVAAPSPAVGRLADPPAKPLGRRPVTDRRRQVGTLISVTLRHEP